MVTFAGIISSVITGKYSDSHGRKPVLFTGMALYALVFFLFALFGRGFTSFLVLRFIEGFAFYMTPVAITTMAADIFPREERGRAMSLYTMSSGVGQLVGPIFAGYFIAASNFFNYFIFCGVFTFKRCDNTGLRQGDPTSRSLRRRRGIKREELRPS